MQKSVFLKNQLFGLKIALFVIGFIAAASASHADEKSLARTIEPKPAIATATNSEGLWDLKLGFNGRTYPIGAQLIATGGYNYRLWGDSSTWKYGFVRTAMNVATSAVVNRVGGEVQLFPISILGITAGYDTGTRNITMKFLDCNQFECNGRTDRKYLKLNAAAAYRGVIVSFFARYENLRAPSANKPFFDESTLLIGRQTDENMITYNPALLYTVNDRWKVGATSL